MSEEVAAPKRTGRERGRGRPAAHPEVTPAVLDQLAAFNAKAIFFLIGAEVVRYPVLDGVCLRKRLRILALQRAVPGEKNENAILAIQIAL